MDEKRERRWIPGDKADYVKELVEIINKNFDLRPGCIVRELGLDKPIFKATAAYGHFGRDEFPWEKCKELVM